MSDPLRIALVAEGPTDKIVIEAALKSILDDRSFILKQLQPEGSLAFGPLGSGWTGVYRWCRQASQRGQGWLSRDALLFAAYDLLILHVDADVAGMRYEDSSIAPAQSNGELPCERPCPPASATTNCLRRVVLCWCGEERVPNRVVFCMPSKSTEAWVLAALFPSDVAMRDGIECYPDPEIRLGQQKKRHRIRKCQRDYQERVEVFCDKWHELAGNSGLGEAQRFHNAFKKAVACLGRKED
jgi:hypothetical protein